MRNKVYVSGIVAFILSVLITTIMLVSFRPQFFSKMYHSLDTAQSMGMSNDDLDEATTTLLQYIRGKKDSIDLVVTVNGESVEMFNAREKAHMVDVRALYKGAVIIRSFMGIYAAVMALVALGLNHWSSVRQNRDNLRNALIIVGVFIGGVALYALTDFNVFWTQFHKLFFSNDLWLLNPATDRMIQMFPEAFFNAMVNRILIAFVCVFGIILLVYGYFEWRVRHDSRRTLSS